MGKIWIVILYSVLNIDSTKPDSDVLINNGEQDKGLNYKILNLRDYYLISFKQEGLNKIIYTKKNISSW